VTEEAVRMSDGKLFHRPRYGTNDAKYPVAETSQLAFTGNVPATHFGATEFGTATNNFLGNCLCYIVNNDVCWIWGKNFVGGLSPGRCAEYGRPENRGPENA